MEVSPNNGEVRDVKNIKQVQIHKKFIVKRLGVIALAVSVVKFRLSFTYIIIKYFVNSFEKHHICVFS